ncbi:MAG TPA: MFS transporter [Ktedonobacteraceae bacterium]
MLAKYLRFRFHYGWLIAGLTFLALLAAAGMRSTPSVLIVPLEHNFGWSDSTISLAISINLVLYGLSGPFAAALMLRLGMRRVIISALLLIALALFLPLLFVLLGQRKAVLARERWWMLELLALAGILVLAGVLTSLPPAR